MRKIRLSDLEALRAEIQHEREKRRALEQSIVELENTCSELTTEPQSEEPETASHDQSEWRIRYETQLEINEQLEKQVTQLKEKIAEKKAEIKRLASGGEIPQLTKTDIKKLLIQLQRQKNSLESQMRDYEWRIDKEAQLYHKADEKRKAVYFDIKRNREQQVCGPGPTGGAHGSSGPQGRAGEIRRGSLLKGSYVRKLAAKRSAAGFSKAEALSIGPPGKNIAANHRIIDPAKGPIRKASTVRKLPQLSTPRGPLFKSNLKLKTEGTEIKRT